MELTCGPMNVKLVRGSDQAPRPCVPAIRVREASCSFSESTATLGRPVPKVFQVHVVAVQVPWNTPTSVAA